MVPEMVPIAVFSRQLTSGIALPAYSPQLVAGADEKTANA